MRIQSLILALILGIAPQVRIPGPGGAAAAGGGSSPSGTMTFIQMVPDAGTTATLPGNSTNGDLMFCFLSWTDRTNSVAPTDSQSNTYHAIGSRMNYATGSSVEVFYASNITAGGSPLVVSANYSPSSANAADFYCLEYSGPVASTPLEASAFATGAASPGISGNVTTLNTGRLLVGVSFNDNNGNNTPASPYVDRDSGSGRSRAADKVGATATSYDYQFTYASGNYLAFVAAFK